MGNQNVEPKCTHSDWHAKMVTHIVCAPSLICLSHACKFSSPPRAISRNPQPNGDDELEHSARFVAKGESGKTEIRQMVVFP